MTGVSTTARAPENPEPVCAQLAHGQVFCLTMWQKETVMAANNTEPAAGRGINGQDMGS
jgi:hypothetical protein